MTFEVRHVADAGELKQAVFAIGQYFGPPPTDEQVERYLKVIELERVHAARENGRIVGGAAAFSFDMSIPGGSVATAGITAVGVYPTHRRRGALRAMMRVQLDDARERGEPIAALWASEETIYGRFGYGVASWAGQVLIPREYADFVRPFERSGEIRSEALRRPQDRGRADRVRDLPAQALVRGRDVRQRRSGAGSAGVDSGGDARPLAVPARHRLGRDDRRAVAAATPRRARYRMGDALWIRVVDVAAALSARSYRGFEPIVFEIRDAFCEWNEGRWKLEAGRVERTEAEPDLRFDIDVLGSAYLGGVTFGQLQRSLRLQEQTEGAVARADDLFRVDSHPWCPEIF